MPKKIVLAYSGGLDTSVILKWLQEKYRCPVVTFTADLGQGEEVEPARAKAEALGVKEIYIEDLREEFVSEYVFPMFRANTIYEGEYLLGTSIARPLIAKRLVEIAEETGADAISHGATGKGNDQVRFELGAYALKPGIQVIAPWREWDLSSRETLMNYCKEHNIPVDFTNAKKKSPYSMDANLRAKQQELQTSLGDKADIQRKLNEQIRIQAENTNAQAMRLAQVIGPPPPEKSAQAPVIGSKRKKLGKERLRIRRAQSPTASASGAGLNITANR